MYTLYTLAFTRKKIIKKILVILMVITYATVVVYMIGCAENEEDTAFKSAFPPNNSTIDSDEVIIVSFDNTPVTVNVEIQGHQNTSFLWELDGKTLTVHGNSIFRQGKKYVIIITWSTGRKILNYTVRSPQSRPDVVVIPDAALESATPASGSELKANGSINLKFDNNPGTVSVSGGGTVSTSGTTLTITPPAAGYPTGALTITVYWENGDGSQDLTYTVVAADYTAPKVKSSDPKDGAEGVDPNDVFEDGIEVVFTEPVTGDLMLLEGDDLGWESDTDGDTITLTGIAGAELRNETAYTIAGAVADGAGNETEVELTFVTKAR